MPTFDIHELKIYSKRDIASWSQEDIDTVVAYLLTRGWRPTDKNVSTRYVSMFSDATNGMGIQTARFKEPLTNSFKGVVKALKAAIKSETRNNILKQKITEARRALSNNDFIKVQDLLLELQNIAGG